MRCGRFVVSAAITLRPPRCSVCANFCSLVDFFVRCVIDARVLQRPGAIVGHSPLATTVHRRATDGSTHLHPAIAAFTIDALTALHVANVAAGVATGGAALPLRAPP